MNLEEILGYDEQHIIRLANNKATKPQNQRWNNSRIKKKIIPEKIIREIVEFFKNS